LALLGAYIGLLTFCSFIKLCAKIHAAADDHVMWLKNKLLGELNENNAATNAGHHVDPYTTRNSCF
jgi:hypothetical protein